MNKTLRVTLVSAAVAGMLGAAGAASMLHAQAKDKMDAKGKCIGANSCSGKSGCAQAGKNDCAGKNGCEGKGFLETSKAECDAMQMKGKNVKFEAAKEAKMEKKA
jgi:hypothetical protein